MGSAAGDGTDPGQAPLESPRERMLVAAAEVISERGLGNTRIADVAKRVGASPALVVYYFDTKDNLLAEALRHTEADFYRALDQLLSQPAPFTERLEAIVDFAFPNEARGEPRGTWGLRLELWAATFRDPRMTGDRQSLDDKWRALIKRVVIEAGDAVDPGLRTEAAAERFAAGWAALLDGLSVQLALKDAAVDWELARGLALAYASRELGLG